ncbi:MAG TPA: protein kinase [Kofleriaceae bacterium]|nr:protein kinase [Kofleriaceae bacterium]
MSVDRLLPGLIVADRYEILRFLGKGGMGEVYGAKRLALGDVVALKRLLPSQDSPINRRRFATEAQAAAHIRHPNVVQVFDYATDPIIGAFLVMELLGGHTLSREIVRGPIAPDRALWIFSQVCAAVEAGHRRGIVHRDLKPSNVIVATADDGTEIPKVLDFGLAIDQRLEREITSPGTVIGTVTHMAPEQLAGRAVTPAADIFALGVLLYEMITGVLPFDRSGDGMATALAIAAGEYKPAREVLASVPRSIEAAIDAALAIDPERRPSSAERLARIAAGEESGPRSPARASTYDDTIERPITRVTSRPTEEAPAFARFVGRREELARLHDAYARALEGDGQIALIVGEAGAGKSRIVEQLATWAREGGALAAIGRFYDYAGSRPPPLETFLAMLGDRGDASAARAKIDADARTSRDRWLTFAAIADALVGRAAGRPLVLVFDDLQWANASDLELVDHLHRTLGPRGTMIVATAQTGEARELDRWRARRGPSLVEIALAPFDEDEVRAWLESTFRPLLIGAIDVRRLERTSAGNPYVLSELVRHLVARGAIRREEVGWRCAPLDDVELPESVTSMVRARLAELGAQERGVLEIASVIGDQFRVDTLAVASGVKDRELDRAIDLACTARLVTDRGVTPGDDLRFVAPLVRQVLYDAMPARQRRRAHVAVVEALAHVHGDRDDRWAHVFAYHHHAIGAWTLAVAFGVRAAREALGRHDVDSARVAVSRAIDAARRADAERQAIDPADRAGLDLFAGVVDLANGRYDDADLRLARAAEAAAERGLVTLQLEALRQRAEAALARGVLAAAATFADRAAIAALRAGQRAAALEARAVGAAAAIRTGAPDVLAKLDALVADTTPADPPALRARILDARAWARMKHGEWAGAQDDADLALDLARAAGDLDVEQQVVTSLSGIRGEAGDRAGGVDHARHALALALRLGDRRREAVARANLAESLTATGAHDEAVQLLSGALGIFVDIGDRASEGDCRVNVGRVLLALGRRGEALAALERGIELCEATGRREYEGIGNLLLGEAHLDAADAEPARAAFARASEVFAEIGFHARWQSELGAARAALLAHDLHAARDLASSAREHLRSQRAQAAPGHDHAALDAGAIEIDALIASLPRA